MKQIIILLTGTLLFTLSSCKKFLVETPKDKISEANYYKTLSDAQGAVSAIYSPIRHGAFNGPYFLQVEIKADYGNGRGSTANIGQYQGLDQVNIGRTDGLWSDLYQSINYANIAIENIASMNSISKSEQDALIAEAKFMRAFCYFHLVINWGAVPLYMSTEQSVMKRMPVQDVYGSIVSDLTAGEKDLPRVPAQYGHPTSWSAKAFLSEVYLYSEKWDSAQIMAKDVINSGSFSLVPVAKPNDFNNIFGPSADGSPEEIFYLKFNHLDGWGWPLNILWTSSQYGPFGNYIVYETPDNLFLKNWSVNDLRQQFDLFTQYIDPSTGQIEQLPASTPILCSKFRDPDATGRSGYGNSYPFLRYADVLLIYAEANDMAENGPSSLAIEYLNEVKRRAYGYPPNGVSPVDYPTTGWTTSSFRDLVMKERGYEFYMEGKRWEDLKRTKTAAEVILNVKGITMKDAALLWPIPQQEIDTNPEISQSDQNPGY